MRNIRSFSVSLSDAVEYLKETGEHATGSRSSEDDVRRETLRESMMRLDVVSMNMERRQWHIWAMDPELVISIHLYSDGSPVTGTEVQGMLYDLFLSDGTFHRSIMPGMSLPTGFVGVLAKAVVLLWAVFLIAGPELRLMQFFLSKVASITTDFGTELALCLTPDIAPTFMKWLTGASMIDLRSLVDRRTRLLPRAVRIGGFSHVIANVVKAVVQETVQYPQYLKMMRALCRFLRNESYRNHMIRLLDDGGDLKSLLRCFTASFAKWRYETLAVVMEALLKLRTFCQTRASRCVFNNPQEKELIDEAMSACSCVALWAWMSVVYKFVVQPLEVTRRWSLVCPCCEEERSSTGARVKSKCVRAGRRLKSATAFLDHVCIEFLDKARDLSVEACEGSDVLFLDVRRMMRLCASFLQIKFKYLHTIPYLFVLSDCPRQASECISQLETRRPLDNVSIYWRDFLLEDVRQVANEGEVTAKLKRAISVLENCPIDESAGEGYHRGTHYVKQRSTASKLPFIKASVRFQQNLRAIKDFLKSEGDTGRNIVRWEWRNYKRILQVKRRYYRIPVRKAKPAFYKKVYHMDETACIDFSPIFGQQVEASGSGKLDDEQAVRLEYLMVALEKKGFYSLPAAVCEVGEDGEHVEETRPFLFQVLQIADRTHRPKVIQAPADELAIYSASPLALLIQSFHVRHGSLDEPSMLAFEDADPEWHCAFELAPFASLRSSLAKWQVRLADQPCVFEWYDKKPAVEMHPLDDGCPTLLVVEALEAKGFETEAGRIMHTDHAVHVMAGPVLVRKKRYFQVLYRLRRCLAYSSPIPSDQPISYYLLLLKGVTVEAGLGNDAYQRLLKGRAAPALAVADAGDDDIVVCGGDVAPPLELPKARAARPSSKSSSVALPLPRPQENLVEPIATLSGVEPLPPLVLASSAGGVAASSDQPMPGQEEIAVAVGPVRPPRTVRTRDWLPVPGGGLLFRDWYVPPNGEAFSTWLFKCDCRGHPNCQKSRRVNLAFTKRFGEVEIIGFLVVWRDLEVPPNKRHSQLNPTTDAVATWVAEFGDEFTALFLV